jgi:pyridoxine kinase
VAEFHVRYALPASDIIAPNLVELEILCGHPVASVSEAVAAARADCPGAGGGAG